MKKILFALAVCLVSLSLPVRAQVVDSLTVNDIISHSSTIIQGIADIKEDPNGIAYNCICLNACRINDRLTISGVVPACNTKTSKLYYTICDDILVADIVLVPDNQNGAGLITMDFGPLTASSYYTLLVRYNSSDPLRFNSGNLEADIHSGGYTLFPNVEMIALGQLSVLTAKPKVGQPVTAQLDLDWYGGIDSLNISSIKVDGSSIWLTGSCRYGSGSSTHATTTVTIDSLPYPDKYCISASITDTGNKVHYTNVSEAIFKVTADAGWHDPRSMADFLWDIQFPSGIKEDESFQLQIRWKKLVLPDTHNNMPIMQVDSVSGDKVFVSVHYDTTVDMPYDYTYYNYKSTSVTIPGLKSGKHAIVFTGVDEAGRYDYAPCEMTFNVDYTQYTGTVFIGDTDSHFTDEEGRNDLTFSFVGDSLHVQGLLWMQCNYTREVSYAIHGEAITLRAVRHSSRDHSVARYPVDFYLSPCPLDQYTISVMGTGKSGLFSACDTFSIVRQNDKPDTDGAVFVEEGKTWECRFTSPALHFVPGYTPKDIIYYFKGDTIVDGRTCLNMYCDWEGEGTWLVAPFYEEQGKVYFYPSQNATESLLLYDFSAQVGDSIFLNCPCTQFPETYVKNVFYSYLVTDDSDTLLAGGTFRILTVTNEMLVQEEPDETFQLLQSIGTLNGPFGFCGWGMVGGETTLERCYTNDKVFYERNSILTDSNSIWTEGSEWDIYYTMEPDYPDSETIEVRVTYSLRPAEGGYMALVKMTFIEGSDTVVQGYIRNDHDSLIYVRPVMEDGSIGNECLLYDFRKPYEYGRTVRYGVMGGEVREEYIDWKGDFLEYYMQNNGDGRYLPEWKGIIYGYGFIEGPMELFLMQASPGRRKRPKPSNISHVIFTTKGGQKTIHMRGVEDEHEIEVPYDEMLLTGTTWECLEVSTKRPDSMRIYTLQVKEDTIISFRRCQNVYSPEKNIQVTMFEEGRKVYIVNSEDTPEVLLDFGLQEGDRLNEVMSVYVDTIENQGYKYRRIYIDTGADCNSYFQGDTEPWAYYLIEGIGVSKDQYLWGQRPFSDENTISYLLRCWKEDTLVYQAPGYESILCISGIRTAANPPLLYDLQGRRLNGIPQKGIYIHGNKKLIIP